MARCTHCGRVNRDGSVFCQDCGNRLPAPAPTAPPASDGADLPMTRVKAATPVAGVPIGTKCPSCAMMNPPGMNFCRACGTPLRTAPSPLGMGNLPSPAAVAQPRAATASRTCPSCANQTPSGFTFCQHCGARLGAATPTSLQPSGQDAVAATIAASGMPGGSADGEAFAPTIAPRGASAAQAMAAGMGGPPLSGLAGRPLPGGVTPVPSPFVSPFAAPAPVPVHTPPAIRPPFGRLVAVHRDGSDGQIYALAGEQIAVGRSEGDLTFPDDRYLAHRHLQLSLCGAQVIARPLDLVNGVYLRVHAAVPLVDGDQILLGKEVLRFEVLEPAERDAAPALQHGILLFGSPPRLPWGRLRQLVVSGGTRDVIHLHKHDIVLGREDGDLRFPDDEFMSRRHAQLSHGAANGRVTLADLGSANGTYLRLRREHELRPGDLLRLGDQLLRFEPA